MKVILAAPHFPQPRGNTVTVKRIAGSLNQIGVETKIISITDENTEFPAESTDFVHGFHAFRFHEFMQKHRKKINSYIISITGTDLNQDFYDKERREKVIDTLENAKAIHVFTNEAKETIVKELPQFEAKTFVIPQGTSSFPDIESQIKKEKDTLVFLLPAGIRKVKNIPAAIEMLQKLHDKHPHIRLWLAGPVLEEEEGDIIMKLAENYRDWLTYFGEVSFSEMGVLYKQADVLLNSSISEGQASSILEGMDHGLPVIVSGNAGNKSIVEHGKTGFVFNNSNQFLDYAEKIVNNNKLRQQIGKQAANYIAEYHSGKKEAIAFQRLYQHIYADRPVEKLQAEDLWHL